MDEALKKILLATDGSGGAALAARAAIDLSSETGAKLHVVHARQPEDSGAYVPSVPGTDHAWCEQRARRLLDGQTERIEETGGSVVESHLVAGEASEEIAGLAEAHDVDLVVLGRCESGAVGRPASVSEEMSRIVDRPVLVVKGKKGGWPPSRIVVGEDFSEGSGDVARLAATLGGLYGARMLLLHAYPLLDLGQKAPILGVFRVNGEVRAARSRLEELAEELEPLAGTAPQVRVAVGEPADAIAEAAAEEPGATLVIVGSRGLGMLERLRDGSVSTRVLRGVDAPVLICPRREG